MQAAARSAAPWQAARTATDRKAKSVSLCPPESAAQGESFPAKIRAGGKRPTLQLFNQFCRTIKIAVIPALRAVAKLRQACHESVGEAVFDQKIAAPGIAPARKFYRFLRIEAAVQQMRQDLHIGQRLGQPAGRRQSEAERTVAIDQHGTQRMRRPLAGRDYIQLSRVVAEGVHAVVEQN